MDYRRHIRLVIFAFFTQGLFYLRNILLLPILGRCLGPEQFGLWGKIQVLGQIASPLANLGALEGLGRFAPSATEGERRILLGAAAAVVAVTGCVLAAALAAAAPFFAPALSAMPMSASASACLLAAVGIMAMAGNLGQAATNFHLLADQPRAYGILIFLQVAGLLAVAVALAAWAGPTIWMPLSAWTIAPALAAATGFTLALRNSGKAPVAVFRAYTAAAHRMMRYGLPLLPLGIITAVHHGAGRYLLTLLRQELDNNAVGIYTAHYALAGVVAMAFSPFLLFYQPEIARLWDRGDRLAACHLTRQTVKYALLIALPICAGAPVWADTGARLAVGEGFVSSWGVILCAMLAYLLQMIGYFAEVPLQMERRSVRILLHNLFAVAVALAASVALIPRCSGSQALIAAAASSALGFAAYLGLNMLAYHHLAPGWIDLEACLKAILAAAAAAGVARLIGTSSLPRAAMAMTAAALGYLALLLLLGTIRRCEIATAWQAMRKMVR